MPPPTAPRFRLLVLTSLALAAGTLGCSGSDDEPARTATTTTIDRRVPGDAPDDAARLEGREWVLDGAASSVSAVDGAPITLRVSLGEVIGSGGCTTYQGPIDIDGSAVAIGPFTRTTADCDAARVDAEDDYLESLGAVDSLVVEVDDLVLSGPDGTRLAYGTAAPADVLVSADLVGRWAVETIGDPDAGGVPPVPGTSPILSFTSDGVFGGTLGCNTVSGLWTLDEGTLSLAASMSTTNACQEPDGVLDQEAVVVAALDATRGSRFAGGDGLALVDGEDRTTLALRRVG